MFEGKSIERKKGETDETGFESLKREGMALIQELSGSIWTDYNLHDPGVTILEQACYALTDIMYRTGFAVEDYLCEKDGNIDSERQALHPPEVILPCRPATVADYRKCILNAVPEIDNVWFGKVEDRERGGLYRIAARIARDAAKDDADGIRDRIWRVFSSHRNLCEDIDEIVIVPDAECELHALIEIGPGREPAGILAEIYYHCSRKIAAEVRFTHFEEALREGESPEEIFRGPFTSQGVIRDKELDNEAWLVRISDLFSIIKSVDGVEQIKSLFISKDRMRYYDSVGSEGDGTALCLRIPQTRDELGIRLTRNGRDLPVSIKDVRAKYGEMIFKHRSMRRTHQDISTLFAAPRGERRDLQAYYSIQNHFPSLYGVNRFGAPASSSPEEKAKVAQLRGYLLLFEQIMANYTANLRNLRNLFSLDGSINRSYFHQVVGSDGIPLKDIYPENPAAVIGDLMRRHDPFTDRRNRLLDYLIALYGEEYPQETIKNFGFYTGTHAVERSIVDNKGAFLNAIVELGRDRGGAFDYSETHRSRENISGLKRRISFLLGFNDHFHRPLTAAMHRKSLKLISDAAYKKENEKRFEVRHIGPDDIDDRTQQVFREVPFSAAGEAESWQDVTGFIPVERNIITESLLRRGIYLDSFRIGSRAAEKTHEVVFKPEAEDGWWPVGTFADMAGAVQSVNALRRFLISLNIESEGVHIVEHILLRAKASCRHEDIHIPGDFHSFRISVLFPLWTARCHDENFRRMAEETVGKNCPGHIQPGFYWLEFDRMRLFERLYGKWLNEKMGKREGSPKLDAAARDLIVFLLENEDRSNGTGSGADRVFSNA